MWQITQDSPTTNDQKLLTDSKIKTDKLRASK